MSYRRCKQAKGCSPRRQGGAALVIALLIFGLCAALMVAMKSEFELFYQRSSNTLLAEQSLAYLRGAEELAALALKLDYDIDNNRQRPRDDLGELWAQPSTPYPLDEGGMLQGHLEDLQGRFNLNNLQGNAPGEKDDDGRASLRFTPQQAQFVRLLQSFEEPALSRQEAIMVTQSLRDWLDADSVPQAYGAEDDYYYAQTPSYRAANRALASVSELRAVAHVTPELYLALRPWVTVLPPGTKLNIHTAPAQLLRSLGSADDLLPLPADEVQALVELRQEVGFSDLNNFLDQPLFDSTAREELKTLLGEQSSYFLLTAVVEVADRTTQLYSVLHRNQRRVEVLARSAGEL